MKLTAPISTKLKAARGVTFHDFFGLADSNDQTVSRAASIDAAVDHLYKSELESAITLATAVEGPLPDTERRRTFAYLREHALSRQVDIDKTINWLKRSTPPDAATIFEVEAAVVIARVMDKFAAAYTEAPNEWYDFLSWGVVMGHWPTLPSME